ncbi:acyl-CoA thioesterase domain-containing protein [Actinomycetospora termitidis]|uniref:Thioesterase family protein n=1 Tax=Actinomycetospora termitidis TaxID=3053470 RepID=A0ABT7MFN0_9PSEU|nr:acyl-CoA thioesterase domain-containing protein [Actinomycetospora sp. Odt1-22]MDL5158687.1 thioesterase family protein [Actinomycetospora sp. Odt1-22]
MRASTAGSVDGSTAFFRADGEHLVPLRRARSGWGGSDGPDQIRGTAVSAILARAAERAADELEHPAWFRPVRWTLDLFRPAAMAPVTTTAAVVRSGRRLRLVDATLDQDGRAVARASLLLLATGGPRAGTTWTAPLPSTPEPPPADLVPDPAEPTLYRSDGCWSADRRLHANAARKATWFPVAPIVEGEEPTGLAHVAAVADAANLTSSWGTLGVEYINADLTLTLTRVPDRGAGVGHHAESRVEDDGIAWGTTTVFDEHGTLGSVVVSTLANGERAVTV